MLRAVTSKFLEDQNMQPVRYAHKVLFMRVRKIATNDY